MFFVTLCLFTHTSHTHTHTHIVSHFLQSSRLPSTGDAEEFYEHSDGVFPDGRVRDIDDPIVFEVPGVHGKKSKHLGIHTCTYLYIPMHSIRICHHVFLIIPSSVVR